MTEIGLRRGAAALVLALGIAGVRGVAGEAAAAESPTTWFAQRFTSGDAPLRVDNLWSKGPRLRAETVIAGRPILTLVSGERYLIIDTLANRGVSIRRSARALKADARRQRPFGNEGAAILGQGAEKVGSDQIGRRACDVYRVTDDEGRRETCLTTDEFQLPLQVEIWVRGVGQAVTARYLDWTRGFSVPDTFFEPDPRVQLEHVEYEDYLKRAGKELVGPAPPFFADLLHGTR